MSGRIGRAEQDGILVHLTPALPVGCALLALGSTAGLLHGVKEVTTTKDVGLSVIVLAPDRAVAPKAVVYEFIANAKAKVVTDPEDGSWIKTSVEVKDVPRQVDLIRGKKHDRPDGLFLDRRLLEAVAVAATALEGGRILLPTLTDLVVLKAWASVDQARRAKDAPSADLVERFTNKSGVYASDARHYAEEALDRNVLDKERIEALLARMAPHRGPEVRRVITKEEIL